jgi:hypothetical protein
VPGSFIYSYQLTSFSAKSFSLFVDGSVASQRNVTGIAAAPTMLSILNRPPLVMVHQPLSLELNSSSTDFASLAGNGTGWRVLLVKPDNSTVDLGLMADWTLWNGVVHKWSMTVPGSFFTKVMACATLLNHSATAVHCYMLSSI